MTITDTLARDNGALDVKVAGDWVALGGLNNWAPSPEKNSADTTKFKNKGWKSHLPASRGVTLTFSGFKQVDEQTGERDPGQSAIEALGRLMGPDGIGEFRLSSAGGDTTVFFGSVNVTWGGGGNDDPNAWEVEIEVDGEPTVTLNAPVPAVVTAPVGTGGAGTISASWTDGVPLGDLFEVSVFNGGVLVKKALSTEKPVLISGLAAGSRTIRIRSRNNAGWSALSVASASITVS